MSITLTKSEETVLLSIAARIKKAATNGHDASQKTKRNAFIDARPEIPQGHLANKMRDAGLYSPSTYLGDIITHIINRRKK